MTKKFVKLKFKVTCDVTGKPRVYRTYRIYLNDEMFAERKLIWDNSFYIDEVLQIETVPGIYEFTLKEIDPVDSGFIISDIEIEVGNANILPNQRVEIL